MVWIILVLVYAEILNYLLKNSIYSLQFRSAAENPVPNGMSLPAGRQASGPQFRSAAEYPIPFPERDGRWKSVLRCGRGRCVKQSLVLHAIGLPQFQHLDKAVTQRWFLALERHEARTVCGQLYAIHDIRVIVSYGIIGIKEFLLSAIGEMTGGTAILQNRSHIRGV